MVAATIAKGGKFSLEDAPHCGVDSHIDFVKEGEEEEERGIEDRRREEKRREGEVKMLGDVGKCEEEEGEGGEEEGKTDGTDDDGEGGGSGSV